MGFATVGSEMIVLVTLVTDRSINSMQSSYTRVCLCARHNKTFTRIARYVQNKLDNFRLITLWILCRHSTNEMIQSSSKLAWCVIPTLTISTEVRFARETPYTWSFSIVMVVLKRTKQPQEGARLNWCSGLKNQ